MDDDGGVVVADLRVQRVLNPDGSLGFRFDAHDGHDGPLDILILLGLLDYARWWACRTDQEADG